MYGMGGGLLGLVQALGGLLLFLLIGTRAWKKTLGAQLLRVLFGGSIIGFLLGIGLNRFILSKTSDTSMSDSEVIALSILGMVVLALILLAFHMIVGGSSPVSYALPRQEARLDEEMTQTDEGEYDEGQYEDP